MCLKKIFAAIRPKKKSVFETEAGIEIRQSILEGVDPKIQEAVVNTINPAAEALGKDGLQDLHDHLTQMQKRLGRKPTFAEFANEMFAPTFQKVAGDENTVNAAKGNNVNGKKSLGDGK